MGFYCFFVLSALRLNISIGIVAMVNWTAIKSEVPAEAEEYECFYNETSMVRREREDGPFFWDTDTQGIILSCYFYGLASTQLLGGRLSELVSAKYVLLVGTLLATLANSLIPIIATTFPSGYGVMALQIFKGFGQYDEMYWKRTNSIEIRYSQQVDRSLCHRRRVGWSG
ncbi:inorganic phosphate cotransporter [Nephila pilipes]|uniref:Inorganic phosphate cotransporter n=1 Tax=Nephila pilipes TaxID=299642 RepID=A0A8X6MQ42_NEPPI|nr:inorganic phosphate cotransporter [Nephila pilipes]